jgi:hypothetical protein
MIKKIAIGSLAVAAVGTFVFGRDAFSYLSTGVETVRDTVRGEVPIEFEIERARHEVEQLVPELQEAIARREVELADQEEAILALSAHLKSGETHFVVHGRSYNDGEVQRDLTERFNRYQVAEEALNADKDTLAARQQALTAHRDSLESMLSQRKSLEVEIERLEARVRTIEARKTISDFAVDDSQLARCKDMIRQIDSQLDVEEELLDADANFAGLIPIEEETAVPEDIVDQVESYFSQERSEEALPAGAF